MKKFLYVFGIMGLFAQSDAMQVGVIKISRKCPKQPNMDGNGDPGTLVLPRVERISRNDNFESNMMSITKIVVPNTVTIIGQLSFFGYDRLTEVEFESGSKLTVIEACAFYGTGIREITIPKSVRTLGECCFGRCKNLKQIKFEDGIQLAVLEPYLFRDIRIGEIVIPASVKELCRYCFMDCEIDRLQFEEASQLTTISEHTFYCSKVKEIQAPDSLKDRLDEVMKGNSAFADAGDSGVGVLTELSDDDQQNVDGIAAPQPVVQPFLQPQAWGTRVAFPIPAITQRPVVRPERVAAPQPQPVVRPERVAAPQPQPVVQPARCDLGSGVVQYCPTLQVMDKLAIRKVIIPNDVKIIMASAFRNYEGLTELIFQENSSLRIIDMYAFENTGITSLSLPASVKELSEACFRNCQKLQSVVFSSNASLTHIIKAAFSNTAIIDIAIPTRVKSIGGRCFANCKQLRSIAFPPHINIHTLCYNVFSSTPIRSIVIPENVHTIGNKCFMNCQCLQDVIFHATGPLKICENAFQKTGIKRIEIPAYVKNIDKECFFESRLQEVKFARRNTGINIDKTAFVSPTFSIVYVQDGLLGQIRSCMPEKVKYYSLEGSALHPEGVGARPVFPSLPGGAVTPQPGVQPEGVAARPVFPSLPGAAVTPQPGVHPEGVAVRPVFPVLETDEQSEDVDEQP